MRPPDLPGPSPALAVRASLQEVQFRYLVRRRVRGGGGGRRIEAMARGDITIAAMVGAVVVLRGAGEGLKAFGGPGAELRAFAARVSLPTDDVELMPVSFCGPIGSLITRPTSEKAVFGSEPFPCGVAVNLTVYVPAFK